MTDPSERPSDDQRPTMMLVDGFGSIFRVYDPGSPTIDMR